jgi:hypothetical protein
MSRLPSDGAAGKRAIASSYSRRRRQRPPPVTSMEKRGRRKSPLDDRISELIDESIIMLQSGFRLPNEKYNPINSSGH